MRAAEPGLSPGRHAGLIVTDNGIGMDAGCRGAYFLQPFHRRTGRQRHRLSDLPTVFGIILRQLIGGFTLSNMDSEQNRGAYSISHLLPVVKKVTDLAEPTFKPEETAWRNGNAARRRRSERHSRNGFAAHELRLSCAARCERRRSNPHVRERSSEIGLVVLDMVMPRIMRGWMPPSAFGKFVRNCR